MSFIVGNPGETRKLFSTLKEGRHPLVLMPYFLPSCLPEQFVEMYQMVSISLSAGELQACLSCFHVKQWWSESKPSYNELLSFLDVVLDAISKYGETVSDASLQAHLISFKDIISLPLEGSGKERRSILVVSIQRIWRRLVATRLSGFLLRYIVFLNFISHLDLCIISSSTGSGFLLFLILRRAPFQRVGPFR